eukprot:scaffold8225_cov129-Isochrysis_galbana.AAC.3
MALQLPKGRLRKLVRAEARHLVLLQQLQAHGRAVERHHQLAQLRERQMCRLCLRARTGTQIVAEVTQRPEAPSRQDVDVPVRQEGEGRVLQLERGGGSSLSGSKKSNCRGGEKAPTAYPVRRARGPRARGCVWGRAQLLPLRRRLEPEEKGGCPLCPGRLESYEL